MTLGFQTAILDLRNPDLKSKIYDTMKLLASASWGTLEIRKYDMGSIMSVNVSKDIGLVFEIFDTKPKRTICYYDLAQSAKIKEAVDTAFQSSPSTGDKTARKRTMAYSKIIPDWALESPQDIEDILRLQKANLLLTPEQAKILAVSPPLLINGRAGSGKTLLLCYALGRKLRADVDQRPRLAFLSYNERLVDKARIDTEEFLQGNYRIEGRVEGVNFSPLQDFLKSYVKDASRYNPKGYVGFSRFSELYESYKRGLHSTRRVPAEKAWHGIRSILKGSCLPPSTPPLSKTEYERLARTRKEFAEDEFEVIYEIGLWYQTKIIKEGGLWDDQDLAWEALSSIMRDKTFTSNMVPYDSIYCDEAQDLTQLEFRTLSELCRQPDDDGQGLQLVMAGDPLQTINPTGFRWNIAKNEVYRLSRGIPVQFKELAENLRSDKKIVDFANQIQAIRGHYADEQPKAQEGFLDTGEVPQAVVIGDHSDVEIIKNKLGGLPPESAVIVWPEDRDAVSELCGGDPALASIDRDLDLYTVSEAKGLEFRLVILYKLGSSRDAIRLGKYLGNSTISGERKASVEDEIPLLYFLNRLYVAVTRARLFLIILDTEEGIGNFWSLWKEYIELIPKDKTQTHLDGSPAFQVVFSQQRWRVWAQTLLDQAEETHDFRTFERARRAFIRAGDENKAKGITARVQELQENWNEAGRLYSELGDFQKAGNCYELGQKWKEAYQSYERLPSTTEVRRRSAICKFRRDIAGNPVGASDELHAFAMHDQGLGKAVLIELADVLTHHDSGKAADIYEQVGRRFSDKQPLGKAARLRAEIGEHGLAVGLFEEAGDTNSKEYYVSLAESLLHEKDYARAMVLFSANGVHQRVVDSYEVGLADKAIGLDGKTAAESYAALGRTEEASIIYEALALDYEKRGMWREALDSIQNPVVKYDRRIERTCSILGAVAQSEKGLSQAEREIVLQAARVVVIDPYWDIRVEPKVMGIIFSRCAGPREVADFHAKYTDEDWGKQGYLTALSALKELYHQNHDEFRSAQVGVEIAARKREWGLT